MYAPFANLRPFPYQATTPLKKPAAFDKAEPVKNLGLV